MHNTSLDDLAGILHRAFEKVEQSLRSEKLPI